VGSGRYDAAFAAAAAALKKPGDISPIVKTPYGFHVLKLVAHAPDRQKSFDEVHDELVERLRTDYVGKAVQAHTGELRAKKLDADPDLVASLRTRYLPKQPVPADPSPPQH
ncbi:MAG TPA: peptidyl-prolyl cis-trans isomerase, partial [Rhodanobacteraceae bacterium]|nr:peptidyl-prolyl cis-trans isomerase [Rhodanobacteraceae bacterium]